MKIYRRGLLHALRRMGRNPYHFACNHSDDYVHCLRCLSVPPETIKEGSKLHSADSPLALRLENDFEEHAQRRKRQWRR